MIIEFNYQTYQIMIACVAVALSALFTYYFLYIKRRMKVEILKKYRGGYRTVYSKRVPLQQELLTKGKHTYTLTTENVIENKRGIGTLYFEEGNLDPLTFWKILDEKGKPIKNRSSRLLTDTLKSNVRKKLMGGGTEKTTTAIIIVLIVALVAVTIFSFWQYNEMNNRIIELLKDGSDPIVIN